jgi:hypothetical protein
MMRAIFWLVGFSVLAADVYGQNTKPEQAHKTIVLTGCLQAGSSPSLFRLTNASPSPEQGVAGQPSPAQPAPRGTSGEASEYELTSSGSQADVDAKAVDLGAHVGHRVEINVRPIAPVPAVPPKPGDTAAAKSPVDEKLLERMSVVAIKHVAAVCP